MNEIERIKRVYKQKYTLKEEDYNYPYNPRNPISIYIRHTLEKAIIKMLNKHNISLRDKHILDVGCGSGGWLNFLVSLGAFPQNCTGIDLMENRIEKAKVLNPQINFYIQAVPPLPFSDSQFDIVMQFSVFSSITNDDLRSKIALEMVRVLKNDGWIIWMDMKYSAKDNWTKGFKIKEIEELFPGMGIIDFMHLHNRLLYRLAGHSIILLELLDLLPFSFLKGNLLVLMKKA